MEENSQLLINKDSIYGELESLKSNSTKNITDWFYSVSEELTRKLFIALSSLSLTHSCHIISTNYTFWVKLKGDVGKLVKGRINRHSQHFLHVFALVGKTACSTNNLMESLLSNTFTSFLNKSTDDESSFSEFYYVRDVLKDIRVFNTETVISANKRVVRYFVDEETGKRCRNNHKVAVYYGLVEDLEGLLSKWTNFLDISDSPGVSNIGIEISDVIKQATMRHRMSELFEIVIRYPESKDVARELGFCIGNVNTYLSEISESLIESFTCRLLHQGVPTTDILNAYISSILSLNDIDNTGILVRIVCEPIKRHLRTRKGILHAVVSAITDNALLETNYCESNCVGIVDELLGEIDTKPWKNWKPRPVFDHQIERDLGMRSSDLLTLLGSIYGTKESLLKEYRQVLAEKIINSNNFDMTKEHNALKMLRNRFGDKNLHKAEVMFYDLMESVKLFGESERIFTRGDMYGCLLRVVVISDQFWPEQNIEVFKLPNCWAGELAKYENQFVAGKRNRSLRWIPNIGLMTLQVDHLGETFTITTTPSMAAILHCFVDNDVIEYTRLADILQFEDSRALKSRVDLWISKGVLVSHDSEGVCYVKLGKLSNFDLLLDSSTSHSEESELEIVGGRAQSFAIFEKYWPQVTRMLKNMPAVTAQKIYSAMRLFAHASGNSSFTFGVDDIISFTETRIEVGQIIKNDNVYTFV